MAVYHFNMAATNSLERSNWNTKVTGWLIEKSLVIEWVHDGELQIPAHHLDLEPFPSFFTAKQE